LIADQHQDNQKKSQPIKEPHLIDQFDQFDQNKSNNDTIINHDNDRVVPLHPQPPPPPQLQNPVKKRRQPRQPNRLVPITSADIPPLSDYASRQNVLGTLIFHRVTRVMTRLGIEEDDLINSPKITGMILERCMMLDNDAECVLIVNKKIGALFFEAIKILAQSRLSD
jgi:hypothetical protein